MAPVKLSHKDRFASMRRSAVIALISCVCLPSFAVGSFLGRKAEPKSTADDFLVRETAMAYSKMWQKKHWQSTSLHGLCDDKKLPNATNALVDKVCGGSADKSRCVCNLAKAHSCHIGCVAKKLKNCPAECESKHCTAGDPTNGGTELSGGYSGKCYNYCSANYYGMRYCGIGTDYQSSSFLDCTECVPASKDETPTPGEEEEMWTDCMADCFPQPTCTEMCAEGGPECYPTCVANYRSAVEPYYSIFKDSSVNVLDLFVGDTKAKEKADKTAGGAIEKEVETIGFWAKEMETAVEGAKKMKIDDTKEQSSDIMLRKLKHTNTMQMAKSLGLVD